MKILVIHQYYLMQGMPGGSRFNEFARLWTEQGHEVTVVAGNLDYSSGTIPSQYRGRWVTAEWDGRVKVLRCHVPSSYGRSYLGRMWAFAGFTVSSLAGLCRAERPDVIIATSPPLVAAIPGWAAARIRLRNVPWIFEVRDLWPESAVTTGVLRRESPITRVLYALERFAAKSADAINVLTPEFAEDMVKRGIADRSKLHFIPNGADESLVPGPKYSALRHELEWGKRFVVMYAGAHGRANALGQLVEAAELLRSREDILFAFVGDGPERGGLEAEARRRNLPNVVFYGPQPKDRMPAFVQACDVGAAVLQDNPTFRTVYPNKVFDYMACERPVLLAIDGAARRLVCEEAGAGVFVKPEDAASLASTILALRDDPNACEEMGRRGRSWVLANVARRSLSLRYVELMEQLVRTSSQRAAAPSK